MKECPALVSVCQNIAECAVLHKNISEEQMLLFIDALASEDSGEQTIMAAAYKRLRSVIGEVWQYREWEEMSPEQAFLYGSIWGSMKSFDLSCQKNKDADQMKLLVPKFKDKMWLFRAIKSQPGILHKELALKGKISPSRLSQIMDDEDMNTLISHRLSGREKYYFLKPRGEELFCKLKSESQNVLGSYTEPCKAISIDNSGVASPVYRETGNMAGAPSGDLIMLVMRMLDRWEEMMEILCGNGRLASKTMVEVNGWTRVQLHREMGKSRRLENGLEMSLAG